METILARERQKQEIRETFARDLKRFQQLKDIPEEAPREEQSQQPSELANLIECRDKVECERMWQQALSYLRQHATVPIETAGDDVAMTQPPLSVKDIALTVSRIWNPNRSSAVIFLDLQCRSYSASADVVPHRAAAGCPERLSLDARSRRNRWHRQHRPGTGGTLRGVPPVMPD